MSEKNDNYGDCDDDCHESGSDSSVDMDDNDTSLLPDNSEQKYEFLSGNAKVKSTRYASLVTVYQ